MSINERWRRGLVPALGGLVAGLALGVQWPLIAQAPVRPQEAVTSQAPAAFPAEAPPARGLDANLYMQTAAEYRACCYQAYNLATRRLRELQAEAKGNGKPLAVVLDLDETALDNAGYQAMLLRSGLAYDQRLWDMWEGQYDDFVGLIPGAKEFIDEAGKQGVTAIYISNRSEKFRNSTDCALKRLGIPAKKAELLKLTTGPGDKTKRRQEVEKEYRVLLYLGDNLRDFDETFRCSVDNTSPATRTTDPEKLAAAIRERKDKVDQTRAKWGAEWIILPNPAYGEWTKPLGLGTKDLDRLVPVGKKP
jgi:5'-nucleotidase (lipoprotein e(P4) family)